MLSKHNLYPKIGGEILPKENKYSNISLTMWVLYLSDGSNTINEIAKKLQVSTKLLKKINNKLVKKNLLKLNK